MVAESVEDSTAADRSLHSTRSPYGFSRSPLLSPQQEEEVPEEDSCCQHQKGSFVSIYKH